MNVKQFIQILTTVTAVLLTASYAVAQGNGGGHGNGGGGGGGGHGPSYQIVPFDPPALPSTFSRVFAINENGQAVGVVDAGGQSRAVHLDTQSDTYTILSDGGTGGAVAMGNNDNDQTVGTTSDSVAALWQTPASAPTPLLPLPGDDFSEADDINNEGIIVGGSAFGDGGGDFRAAAWYVDTGGVTYGPFELPPLSGHIEAIALDVSEAFGGTVAIATGESVGSSSHRAVRWIITINPDGSLTTGTPEDLGTLGGDSIGHGINAVGDVCGRSNNFPFIALSGETAQPLPVGNALWGIAYDINDIGDIVGSIFVHYHGNYENQATLWQNGEAVNLNSYLKRRSGWQLESTAAITNGGVIGGTGIFDVDHRGFILLPD